jgi:hypothetical protein
MQEAGEDRSHTHVCVQVLIHRLAASSTHTARCSIQQDLQHNEKNKRTRDKSVR